MSAAATARITVREVEPLAAAVYRGQFGAFASASPFASCLIALLAARNWRGDPRRLMEALPHFADDLDPIAFRNVLAVLGLQTRPVRTRLAELDPRLMPCLFAPRRGAPLVALSRADDGVRVHDGASGEERTLDTPGLHGIAYPIVREADTVDGFTVDGSLRRMVRRFRASIAMLVAIGFILDVMALLVPITVMLVYDVVIGARDLDLLRNLVAAAAIVLAGDLLLRTLRAALVALLSARAERLIGSVVFAHLLHLAPAYTESVPVDNQVARIKELESVREFFSGPLVNLALEGPFSVIFLAAVLVIGGPILCLPLIVAVTVTAAVLLLVPMLRKGVREAGELRSARQAFLVETLATMRLIRASGAVPQWSERNRRHSAELAMRLYQVRTQGAILQTVGHSLTMVAGGAMLAIGAAAVIEGAMTVGALVASLALGWRVLSPLYAAFAVVPRFEQARSCMRQIAQLLRVKAETVDLTQASPVRRVIGGKISFQRVSMRYKTDADPALFGVTFDVTPGEMVAIVGPSGAGKSSVLKLVAGMCQAQAGAIAIDGLDLRQLDPRDLRIGIAYVPQHNHLFHGTIAQNLRLAMPAAAIEELHRATDEAGILDRILEMPDGFGTHLKDQTLKSLPAGFQQRLALARAYLKDSHIVLLDEPAQALDEAGDRLLVEALQRMKGKRTVLMVTHRPSHVRICDRVLAFRNGVLALDGAVSQASLRMLEGLQ